MARSGEIPHVPYYGSIDATPLWLILLHETWRWTGDTRAGARAAAPRGAGARVDRAVRRPGRRRVRGVRPRLGEGSGQPGLEGLGRRGAVSRRPAARAADRAGRGTGVRLRRQGADGRAVRSVGPVGAGRHAPARGGASCCATGSARRSGWRSSAPSPSRSTGRSGRFPRPPAMPAICSWSRVPTLPEAPPARHPLSGARLLLRLGHPHAQRRASGVQSDELSQRLGVAPRQLDHRARHGAARPVARRPAGRAPRCTRRESGGVPAAAGAVLRDDPEKRLAAGRLSGELRAPGVGVGRALHAAAGAARALSRGAGAQCSTCAIRCCPISSTS